MRVYRSGSKIRLIATRIYLVSRADYRCKISGCCNGSEDYRYNWYLGIELCLRSQTKVFTIESYTVSARCFYLYLSRVEQLRSMVYRTQTTKHRRSSKTNKKLSLPIAISHLTRHTDHTPYTFQKNNHHNHPQNYFPFLRR